MINNPIIFDKPNSIFGTSFMNHDHHLTDEGDLLLRRG